GSSLTAYDIITNDCECEGEVSSQFGCTDPMALNYNLNASFDDESCISSAPPLTPNSSIGCSPLNAYVFASSTLPSDFECYWLLDDIIIIDSTCSELVSLIDLEPALHEISFAVSYSNPYTGETLTDTSFTFIEVIQGADLPTVSYDQNNQYLVCGNCENQIQWFYDGDIVLGSDILFVGSNGIIANGQYEIIHTGSQGCISDTSTFILAEALLQYNVNVGCSPLNVNVYSPIVLIDGMSCNLMLDGVIVQDNFLGMAEISITESGTHTLSQDCSYGDSTSSSTFTLEVYDSFTPELLYNTELQIVTCLNVDLFDSIAWVVDGTYMGSNSSVNANGTYFSCIGYGPGTCQSQNTLNINSVLVSDRSIASNFVIYPVPTKDFLAIQSNAVIIKSTVLDMQGRVVAKFANDAILDLSSLSPGLYILKTDTTTGIVQQPFEIAR
ncbi:MAG: T9SS type A sorting domain-containing protein, partial [Flavobacteriales bacterium]